MVASARVSDGHEGTRGAGQGAPPAADDAVDTDVVRALDDGTGPTCSLPAVRRLAGRSPRDLLGEAHYFLSAVLGLPRARRERDRLDRRLVATRARRAQAVVALAQQAVSTASLEHPAIDEARAALAIIEHDHDEQARLRSETARAAVALRHELEEHGRARLAEITAQERELAALATREAPLEGDVARLRRQQAELAGELERLDAALTRTEGRRERAAAGERAAHDAPRATPPAHRARVARDRPALEVEVAALLPRLAELEAARAEAQARLDAARAGFRSHAEQVYGALRELAARTAELDQADAAARATRHARLAALGERLVLERPPMLRRPLDELDELDAAIATDQRRLLDVADLIDGVDRRAMVRGGALVALVLAALLALLWFLG
jgi:DNA repair exonuclease SbcCD ATPase subunit